MLRKCLHCKKKFETLAPRRDYCHDPGCEKAHKAALDKVSKKANLRWRQAHPDYYKKKNLKFRPEKPQKTWICQHCGKPTTNRINCRACLYKLSKRVPDYYNTYDNWGDLEWEGEEGKEVLNLELE